jgi:hypothetical protein
VGEVIAATKKSSVERAAGSLYNPTHMQLVLRRARCSEVVALGFAICLASGACSNTYKPCASMGASDLVNRAALVRLDVYGAGAACSGSTLAANAPAPSQTSLVGPGQAIKIKVPAGHHVLLLSAFADADGTQLLGSACTETDLKANEPACFNLVLLEPPDGGIGPACTSTPVDDCAAGWWCGPDNHCARGCRTNADCAAEPETPFCVAADHRCVACTSGADCAPGKRCSPAGVCVDGCDVATGSPCPSSLMCCSQMCLDTSGGDILNCGGCGRACAAGAANGVSAAACVGSLCKPSCLDGFADCADPAAPAADDGCETNVHTPNHCGSCTNACTLDHATAKCPSGTCEVDKCTSGFSNCDGSSDNGCECADLGDANRGCCPSGGCEIGHTDGFGHSYVSCLPKGTRTSAAAEDAARAFNPAVTTILDLQCDVPGKQLMKCNKTSTVCACFTYADQAASAYVGHARRTFNSGTTPPSCACPLGTLGTDEVLWDPN